MIKILDTRKTPVAINDAARPFAVLVGSKIVGRYATEAQAKRRVRGTSAAQIDGHVDSLDGRGLQPVAKGEGLAAIIAALAVVKSAKVGAA